MHRISFILFLFALLIVADSMVRAVAAHADSSAAAIVTDTGHGIVRVMIRGKEVARFTADGLQVRDSIEYGGTITDIGTAHFDDRTGGSGAP